MAMEICRKCAECCKHYPFIELSKPEVDAIEKITGLPSERFTLEHGKAVAEYCLQFKDNGDCFFLTAHGGRYRCAIYAARPVICAEYPSNPKQLAACDANRKKVQ